jgi:malonyl-CoA/methylmalonyl-CoA synthetase
VGVEDAEWGERVCVAVILQTQSALTLEDLRQWCKERLAPYKIPARLLVMKELPRNAMGKVLKPKVAKLFECGGVE